jgi:hypothetical protein
MDDFEYAVESQTLPSFLKQDQDHGSTSNTTAQEGGGGLVGENELDRLMREMSEADINAFAEELGGDVGKVGLMVPEGSQPLEGKGVESVGINGTGEVIENPELESEKKMAEVEIGGKVESEAKVSSDKGTGGVVETLKKVEEAVVGADDGVGTGKEKID